VPPTVRLVNNVLGPERAPIVFAWLVVGHQIGSALAAFGAGFIRTSFERYLEAFVISGLACLAAALVALLISRRPIAPKPIPAPQPA
jgi:predicted MFS family arabinose efflux permease